MGRLNRRQGSRVAERLDERTLIGHDFTRDIKAAFVIDVRMTKAGISASLLLRRRQGDSSNPR
jgi:hypothetical protein